MINSRGGLIFISCGQVTDREKKLGSEISALVRQLTPHEPYFAEAQNSLDALTRNILGSLDDAVALIAVMHPRGSVTFPDESRHIRASVWIEQELAIAAFITQVLHRPLRVAPYIHSDIPREGMRQHLHLNAIPFQDDSEVLVHLSNLLLSWSDLPASLKFPTKAKVRVALEKGSAPNYLFKFFNDGEDDIFIEEIKLESDGIQLSDPFVPDTANIWNVPAHNDRTFGAMLMSHRPNPGASLVRMKDKGLFFNTDLDIIFSISVRGQVQESRQKIRVKVSATNNQITQLV